ncbi:uncharacterized protein LOC112271859 [Brachypodium distachyon]|uniref:uncharacterized protein LOC112271859 n=1 Tax=Brachypodium distachyon TaxID=15368 RepID=UPI000D0D9F08|nr:uncharacterized protein LOC112271859 [Brachypodium distachyon]|eukprot:XP_024317826.1 uncharacterized protein LOC112271859 [Brachypodium distachyon]
MQATLLERRQGGKFAGDSIAASVRRFERLADGANEFMRFVQLGGTPHRPHLFFDPLVGHIFARELLVYRVSHPGGQHRIFGIRPMDSKDRGLEIMLSFMYEDHKMPKNNFRLMLMMQLSESTDIIGTTIKCLRQVTPHFKSTADVAIKEITQLPTQDFLHIPSEVAHKEHRNPRLWNHIHTTLTGWFRPDPLCCQGYEHKYSPSCGFLNGISKLRLSSKFSEPICQVYLQCHISLSEYNNLCLKSSTATTISYDNASASLENFRPLKLGILILPHDSLEEDPKSASEAGYAIEAINGEKQEHLTHVNVHPDQLDEMLMPKAVDYLCHNAEATTYQICWRSNHGSAHLFVEKTSIMVGARRSKRQSRNISKVHHRMQQGQQVRKGRWKHVARDFLKLWVVRSSERLRSSILAFVKQS